MRAAANAFDLSVLIQLLLSGLPLLLVKQHSYTALSH